MVSPVSKAAAALHTPDLAPATERRPGWGETLRVYLEAATLRMLLLGFSAGLPLLLVFGSLSFWLREAGIDRTTIGYLSWIGLAYGFKWVWAPLVDRLPIPLLTRWLGRRRSWLLLSQCVIVAALVGMALTDPQQALLPMVWCALAVAIGSATQDIALDAFRIESADVQRQAALAASYQTGYRIAMIWAGAGVLWIAARAEVAPALGAAGYQHGAWQTAYLAMAASMLLGMVTVLLSPEPLAREMPRARNAAEWLKGALVEPFADFLRRYGRQAVLILMLIAVYRISDVVMGIMANPFYVDMGFTKDEVAAVTKVFGVIMTLVGAFVGGALAMRLGVMRVLMLGAVLSAGSNLLFARAVEGIGAGTRMTDVSWYRRDRAGMVTEIVRAPEATYAKPGWHFSKPTGFDVQSARRLTYPDAQIFARSVNPAQVVIRKADADGESITRLSQSIAAIRSAGYRTSELEGKWWHKLSGPLSALLMPLLGAVAAFGLARSGMLFVRAVIGMALGFAYFVVDNAALAMGNFGGYPPLLAAWAPFFLFLLIGETVLVRTEE